MEKFSKPFAEGFAGRMRNKIDIDHKTPPDNPSHEEYEEAFRMVSLSSESLEKLISVITRDPEIIKIVANTDTYREARSKVTTTIINYLKGLDPKFKNAILSQEGLFTQIINQVVFSTDEDLEEDSMTVEFPEIEREYDVEFTVREVAEEISRSQGLDIGELDLIKISKDKNGKTFELDFDLVGGKGYLEISYNFIYPFSGEGAEDDSPECPTVLKIVYSAGDGDSRTIEEALRMKERMDGVEYKDTEFSGHTEYEILRFENGSWQDEK